MIIKIRKKKQPEWITLFVLVMPFLFFLLMECMYFPSLVKYVIDIGWLLLMFYLLRVKRKLPNAQAVGLLRISGAFFALSFVGFLFHYISGWYYLWGIRNNIRFFVFFFACICFIKEHSVEKYLKFFEQLFWINVPAILFQYFVLGKDQDHLGGIFGTERGCNGYTNIFLLIIVTYTILRYMHAEEKLFPCLLKCAVAMIIAALSELKMFYIEMVAVIALAMIVTKFSFRKVLITLAIVVGILAGIRLLIYVFPMYDDWFSLEKIWKSAASNTGYTSSNDINRITAVSFALKRFLPTNMDKLFGLGMGNCDYASFDFLITPFYRQYGRLNYTWFSSAFLVLETGLVGLVIYCWFFVALFFAAGKRNQERQAPVVYCKMAQILSLMCLVLVVYNSSLRTEAAFMMYFILALPFLPWKTEGKEIMAGKE